MKNHREDIYTILDGIAGLTVYQTRPEVLTVFPVAVFAITDQSPQYVLEREIGYEDVSVTIDIWADNSKKSAELLASIEEAMRGEDYLLMFSSDIPDPDGKSRITTRFNFLY